MNNLSGGVFPLLILYGLTGMFFSEILVWNAKQMAGAVSANGPAVFPVLLSAAYLIYFLLLAAFLDIAARHGARRPGELLLLGSLFGIVNEGVFAPVIFAPNAVGVNLLGLAFTSLAWHPFFCFYINVKAVRYLFGGENSLLSGRPFRASEAAAAFAAGFLWYSMLFMPWCASNFPNGMPLYLRLAGFLFPALIFAFARFAFNNPPRENTGAGLLSRTQFAACIGALSFFALFKFKTLTAAGNSRAAVFLLMLGAVYWLLFTASVGSGKCVVERSSLRESLKIKTLPRFAPFVKLWLIVGASFAACETLSRTPLFAVYAFILSRIIILSALIFAVSLPACALFAALRYRKKARGIAANNISN
jgi:hypothetical protein